LITKTRRVTYIGGFIAEEKGGEKRTFHSQVG